MARAIALLIVSLLIGSALLVAITQDVQDVSDPFDPGVPSVPWASADIADIADIADVHLDVDVRSATFMENPGNSVPEQWMFHLRGGSFSATYYIDRMTINIDDGKGGLGPPITITFEGCRDVMPIGSEPLEHRTSVFRGNDPGDWLRGARNFQRLEYRGLWEGIDLVYYFADGALKYDLVLDPGVDPGPIVFTYQGADRVGIDGNSGELVVSTPLGDVRDAAPVAYQPGPVRALDVPVAFVMGDADTVSFWLGEVDPTLPVVIDPALEFSTFMGASADDNIRSPDGFYVDDEGYIYMAGYTRSSQFPTSTSAYASTKSNGQDCILLKFDQDNQELVYSTFIGGRGEEWSKDIHVNETGCVYLIGYTTSDDFPTTSGVMDTSLGGNRDCFVLLLNDDGSDLVFSTYVGGGGQEQGTGIAVDDNGTIFCAGYLVNEDGRWPTTAGAFDTDHNGRKDCFVFSLLPDASAFVWSSYLGGNYWDHCRELQLDANGDIYVTGNTDSTNFPTTVGAYDRTLGSSNWPPPYDIFVTKIKGDGSAIIYSTYVGGVGDDYGEALYLLDSGAVLVGGITKTADYPTTSGAYDEVYNGEADGVLLKLTPNGDDLVFSTVIGGSDWDDVRDVDLDAKGNIWVTGSTKSGNFPMISEPYQTNYGGGERDQYIAKFSNNGRTLMFSTYLGGFGEDWGAAISVPDTGAVYIAGDTRSGNFPTVPGSFDTTYNSAYDLTLTKMVFGKPPTWFSVPVIEAVEDVPLKVDFSVYVRDPDTEMSELEITAVSPYVSAFNGLEVTFEFPDGVTSATITLYLSDGGFKVLKRVNFVVEPVNDPPKAFLPEVLDVKEDIPLIFDATAYVSDIDNATEDLWLMSNDPFVTTEGLILTATLPDGLVEYEVQMGLTDGLLVTNFFLTFTIEPVNDPPVIAPLGTFVAIEDQVSIFNLTPFLSDVDTPVEDLSVIVRSARCTVHGQDLHFHNAKGGFNETLLVQVTDGWSMVEAYLEVVVEERNDPPFVYTTEPQQFTEDTQTTIDMAEYVTDEDTEIEDLTLTCKHPAVVSIHGLTITFNFTTWRPEHEVYYNVTDGYLITEGHFLVQVLSVNDAPRIHAIGDQEPPIVFELDEGASTEHQVWVVDEDDTNFKYLLSTQWAGATLGPNGMLVLDALQGDVGEYLATIMVEDPEGAQGELTIIIMVRNLNDGPTLPVIMKPANHTIVERGTNVTFAVSVTDPDEMYGQVLMVTWTSDISGIIGARTTEEGLEFSRSDLVAGVHRITVQVSDGEYVEESWFVLEVIEPYVSPHTGGDPSFLQTTSGIGLILLVVLALIIIALLLVIRSRSDEERPKVRTYIEHPEATAEGEARKDLAALGAEIGAMADQLEATRAAEGLPMYGPEPPPPSPAALDLEDVAAPTAEDYAERQHAIQVREVMKVLTQLPRGMPTTLWGKDMSLLAREIVDGPKRTAPDGTELVQIDSRWYNSDHTNVGTFLSEWKEEKKEKKKEKTPPRPSADDKALRDKLDKLEERLLDGDISEETYERLRKKFEGS